jgi:hypothetical protein
MKKFLLFSLSVILYADISNILEKINTIENYKIDFKPINLKKCRKMKVRNKKKEIEKKLILKAFLNKKVLINDKWLKVGDVIEDYQVVKIYSKKVVLKKDNKFYILEFNNTLIRIKK